MPKFAKGSKEAKDYMASLRAKRGEAKGKGMRRPPAPEPAPAHNNPLAQPHYWNGVEWVPIPLPPPIPANQILEGDDIIEGEGARRRKTKGGRLPEASYSGPSNRDLTPEIRDNVLTVDATGRGMRKGETDECEYCPCSHCGGMGLKKKTRM